MINTKFKTESTKIVKKVINQISLFEQVIDKYTKDIETETSNQKKIENDIQSNIFLVFSFIVNSNQ